MISVQYSLFRHDGLTLCHPELSATGNVKRYPSGHIDPPLGISSPKTGVG